MFPFPAFWLPSGGLSLAFVDSSSSTASGIAIPSGAQEGDFAFCWEYVIGGSGSSPFTGWTQIFYETRDSTPYRAQISYKKLASGDAGTTVSGGLGFGPYQTKKEMLVFHPSVAASVTISDKVDSGVFNNADPSAITNSASGGTLPMIVFGSAMARTNAGGGSGDVSFTSQTPSFEGLVPASSPDAIQVGYTIYNPSDTAADQTIDMADAGYYNILNLFTAEFAAL